MTIAISVVLRPSRLLSFATRGLALSSASSIILLLATNPQLGAIYRFQMVVTATILIGSALFHVRQTRKTFHIDISGIGQIRLTQYIGMSTSTQNTDTPLDGSSGKLVHLQPDSILWSHFMLLRLKAENGKIVSIPVLKDSVVSTGFARLLVACKWIIAQPASHKISN